MNRCPPNVHLMSRQHLPSNSAMSMNSIYFQNTFAIFFKTTCFWMKKCISPVHSRFLLPEMLIWDSTLTGNQQLLTRSFQAQRETVLSFVGSRTTQTMMNGKEVKQWPICLAVRGNCHRREYSAYLPGFPPLTSLSAAPQNHCDQIGRVLPKTGWNPL